MLEAIHRWENEGGAARPTEPSEEGLAAAHAAGGAKDEDRPSTLRSAAHPRIESGS